MQSICFRFVSKKTTWGLKANGKKSNLSQKCKKAAPDLQFNNKKGCPNGQPFKFMSQRELLHNRDALCGFAVLGGNANHVET